MKPSESNKERAVELREKAKSDPSKINNKELVDLLRSGNNETRTHVCEAFLVIAGQSPSEIKKYTDDIATLLMDKKDINHSCAVIILSEIAKKFPKEVENYTDDIFMLLNEDDVFTQEIILNFFSKEFESFPETVMSHMDELEDLKQNTQIERIRERVEKLLRKVRNYN